MKNNKGFTLVELLAVVVILVLIMGIAVAGYYGIFDKAKDKVYENYEEAMREAAMQYVIDTGDGPTASKPIRLTLKYLVGEMDNGKKLDKPYLEYFDNPTRGDDHCLENSHGKSYVEVKLGTKKQTTDGKTDNNKKYEYKICLICDSYRSEGC